ncbi:hypothetical protein ACFE04_010859 [Oxalis oulophora]
MEDVNSAFSDSQIADADSESSYDFINDGFLAKQNDGVKPARSLMYCHTKKNKKRDYTSTTASKYGDEFEKAIAAKNTSREKRIQEREENPDLNLDSETSTREESLDNDDYSRIKANPKRDE